MYIYRLIASQGAPTWQQKRGPQRRQDTGARTRHSSSAIGSQSSQNITRALSTSTEKPNIRYSGIDECVCECMTVPVFVVSKESTVYSTPEIMKYVCTTHKIIHSHELCNYNQYKLSSFIRYLCTITAVSYTGAKHFYL